MRLPLVLLSFSFHPKRHQIDAKLLRALLLWNPQKLPAQFVSETPLLPWMLQEEALEDLLIDLEAFDLIPFAPQ